MIDPPKDVIACMGGFCGRRESCAHYYSPSRTISERLCERGKDEPELIHKPQPEAS